jgi:hypothetical protein
MKRRIKYHICTTLAGMAAGSICGLVLGMSESATLFVIFVIVLASLVVREARTNP